MEYKIELTKSLSSLPRNSSFIPAHYQPDFPVDRFVLNESPREDAIPLDVVFVGGGPAGLAGALELARLIQEDQQHGGELGDIQIGILEKSDALGEHCLSGAIINPESLFELFPELNENDFPFYSRVQGDRVFLLTRRKSIRVPTPPSMHNSGNYLLSVCELVRWMGEKASERGINIFTGFPADSLLTEQGRVFGVRTTAAGLNRDGTRSSKYLPPTDVRARLVVLAEGTRGSLTQAYLKWKGISSKNPQIYALGVKELWETKRTPPQVIHTLGWPLPNDVFGGSWLYPMAENRLSFGLVVGLDYREATLDVHELLQDLKTHPLFSQYLKGGEILEWGAKTIPEGGYYSIPKRLHGDGVLITGDAAGLVNVASLKGIHYAIQSGIFSGRTAFTALKFGDTSARVLKIYDEMLRGSFVLRDLYQTRNMRLAFKSGLFKGGLKAFLMAITSGALIRQKIPVEEDAVQERILSDQCSSEKSANRLSKIDAVFRSGNATRDDIPSHLVIGKEISSEVAEFYEHMCPAGVYERQGNTLLVHSPNCIDCKATDILGPRWSPREGGSGPRYRRM